MTDTNKAHRPLGADPDWTPDKGPEFGDEGRKAKKQDASGLGSKVTGTAFKPPKMNPGESSAAYGARVAAARREFEAAKVAGQKQAVKGLPAE